MPRSSRHKSHKHSKHSSRDCSDSEEEVIKTEERSKDENSSKIHRDSESGEKRKGSAQLREETDRDLSGHRNGEALEEYISSKRRKKKTDVIGGDRWCGGVDERGDDDSYAEKGRRKGEKLRGDGKLKECSNKSEEIEIDCSNKSKWYEGGISGKRRDDSLASLMTGKEEGKCRGESKRRLERDSSTRREARELKEKDYRLDKEKNGNWESKGGDSESKLIDIEVGKKQVAQVGDSSKERQGKRTQDHTDQCLQDELQPDRPEEVGQNIELSEQNLPLANIELVEAENSQSSVGSTRPDSFWQTTSTRQRVGLLRSKPPPLKELQGNDDLQKRFNGRQEGYEAYKKFTNRDVVIDNGFDLRLLNHRLISRFITTHEWGQFGAHNANASSWELIREFFANMAWNDEGYSWVRGVMIDFRKQAINQFFGVEAVNDGLSFTDAMRKRQSVADRLMVKRVATTFCGGPPQYIGTGMTFHERQIQRDLLPFIDFYSQKIRPSSHLQTTSGSIFYCLSELLRGTRINLGEFVEQNLKERNRRTSKVFCYANLIRRLCEAAGVALNEFEMDIAMGPPIPLPETQPAEPFQYTLAPVDEPGEQPQAPPKAAAVQGRPAASARPRVGLSMSFQAPEVKQPRPAQLEQAHQQRREEPETSNQCGFVSAAEFSQFSLQISQGILQMAEAQARRDQQFKEEQMRRDQQFKEEQMRKDQQFNEDQMRRDEEQRRRCDQQSKEEQMRRDEEQRRRDEEFRRQMAWDTQIMNLMSNQAALMQTLVQALAPNAQILPAAAPPPPPNPQNPPTPRNQNQDPPPAEQ